MPDTLPKMTTVAFQLAATLRETGTVCFRFEPGRGSPGFGGAYRVVLAHIHPDEPLLQVADDIVQVTDTPRHLHPGLLVALPELRSSYWFSPGSGFSPMYMAEKLRMTIPDAQALAPLLDAIVAA